MTESDFTNFVVVNIRSCGSAPRSKVQNEYSVEFATIAERDFFKSYASRLQPFNRTAGIRLSLPDFLVSTFKKLENESFRIVKRKPGTKRSIKFEDVSKSLIMDVKLPGATRVCITPDDVLQATGSR